MVRIAIVEDDAATQGQLAGFVRQYEAETGGKFSVALFSDGDEIVSDYSASFDIIFLDVQMQRMDGIEAAEAIRKMDRDVILVFITNMANYAIKGYAVDAMDYVLKPVPYFAFAQQLQKALAKLQSRQSHYLLVPVDNGVLRLKTVDILYIETAQRHRLLVHTVAGQAHAVPGTLKALEEKLPGDIFIRCNSGYLVNLAHVESVVQGMAQVGGHSLQISRPRKKEFMDALADYIGGNAR